jgi:nucleotide-binding universal stress UspA family protein
VAAQVLVKSPVPVALLRHGSAPARQLRTMLVPMSAAPGSAGALALARDLARAAGAALVLAEVITPLPRYGRGLYIEPHWEEEMRDRAGQFLERIAARLRADGVPASSQAQIGPIGPTLLAIADQVSADLIVMGTHAATGASRAVLGSVADEVVREASQPVLQVRLPTQSEDFSDSAMETAVSAALQTPAS